MPKKANFRKIISTDYYSPDELANRVGVCKQTIYRHIKEGLPADQELKPFLIYGREAKSFYIKKYQNDNEKTKPGEVRCHGCGQTFPMKNNVEKCIYTGRKYNENKIQIQILGYCPYCHRNFSRFKSLISDREFNVGAIIPIGLLTRGEEK